MSGLFRYNSSFATSPKRRPTLNSFCSSPGPNHDATMDNTNGFGYRSPSSLISNATVGGSANSSGIAAGGGGPASGGNTSPGHRQSLRDYDEQLNTLRRENFNLKLRIYFLESNGPANGQPDGKEAVYKQNVDLKVEMETLRAELKEKQILICDAAAALNLIEETQKKSQAEHAERVDELQQKIQFLELEIQALDERETSVAPSGASERLNEVLARAALSTEAQQRIDELQACVQRLEAQRAEEAVRVADAEARCAEQEELARVTGEQYAALFVECEALKGSADIGSHRSENDSKLNQTDGDTVLRLRQQLADRDCEILTLQESVQKQTSARERSCKTLHLATRRIKELENALQLQSTSTSTTSTNKTTSNSSMSTEMAQLSQQLAAAQQEAAEANAWRAECSDVCTALTVRLNELAEFLDTLLRNKEVLGTLGHDRRRAMRRAIDSSLNLSQSLLNMSVSGERYSMLGDSKLLSHSSTMMVTMGGDVDAENKENVLPSPTPKTSQPQQQQQLIDALRAQVRTLEAELAGRRSVGVKSDDNVAARSSSLGVDTSRHSSANYSALKREARAKNAITANQLKAADRHSESDASWSEPDRQVSQARIGLEDSSAFSSAYHRASPKKADASEESSLSSVPSGGPGAAKQLRDQLAEMELKLVQQENVVLKQQCAIVETDNKLKEERLAVLAIRQELADARDHAARGDAKISELTDAMASKLREFAALTAETASIRAHIEVLQRDAAAAEKKRDADEREFERLRASMCEDKNMLSFMRDRERDLEAQIVAGAEEIRTIKLALNEATIQSSLTVTERNKAMAERRMAEAQRDEATQKVSELKRRIEQLEVAKSVMEKRVVFDMGEKRVRTAAAPSVLLLSDEYKQRLENSSPDLGIESDAGRTSGSDAGRQQQQHRANQSAPSRVCTSGDSAELRFSDVAEETQLPANATTITHDCALIDREVVDLKRQLAQQHQAHRHILQQLRVSNNRKEQVERDIRREINKTQSVLQTVRTNIESAGGGTSPGKGGGPSSTAPGRFGAM